MSKRRAKRVAPDDLRAWQEWTSHNPGYWASSGRIPPTSPYGRRPTRAGYVLVVTGVLTGLLGLIVGAGALLGPALFTVGGVWQALIVWAGLSAFQVALGLRLARGSRRSR